MIVMARNKPTIDNVIETICSLGHDIFFSKHSV